MSMSRVPCGIGNRDEDIVAMSPQPSTCMLRHRGVKVKYRNAVCIFAKTDRKTQLSAGWAGAMPAVIKEPGKGPGALGLPGTQGKPGRQGARDPDRDGAPNRWPLGRRFAIYPANHSLEAFRIGALCITCSQSSNWKSSLRCQVRPIVRLLLAAARASDH
jgi:hypothetical protein